MFLKQINNNESPGSDGFTYNFKKCFGKVLAYIYYDQQMKALKKENFLLLKSMGSMHVSPKVTNQNTSF